MEEVSFTEAELAARARVVERTPQAGLPRPTSASTPGPVVVQDGDDFGRAVNPVPLKGVADPVPLPRAARPAPGG